MVDASKLKMHKENTDAKCANFWRERMHRRSFHNLANVSVTAYVFNLCKTICVSLKHILIKQIKILLLIQIHASRNLL